MRIALFLVIFSNIIIISRPEIHWLEVYRACSTVCPVTHSHVCGYDPEFGFVLADSLCVLLQHNLCRKTGSAVNVTI
ncbi:hypothetical protein J6590_025848 [Homalodisca vitripennis]|nr:hypothetical protein J6590_025848 [Homalodisca vitripennis]